MDEEVHLREGALSKVPFNENSKNLNKDLNKDVKKNWKQRNNRKKFYNNKKNDAIESTVMKTRRIKEETIEIFLIRSLQTEMVRMVIILIELHLTEIRDQKILTRLIRQMYLKLQW